MEKVEIQFKTVPGGTYNDAFGMMKEYQNAGLAGKSAKIIFNEVEVPAGYYETCEESFRLYESLVGGDLEEIRQALPREATEGDIFAMESSISKSYKHLHETELSPEYLDSLMSDAKGNGAASR